MSYNSYQKENNFTSVSTLSDADKIRVVVNGSSRNISLLDFNNLSTSKLPTRTVATNYDIQTSDAVIFCNVGGGSITLTLPEAGSGNRGLIYYIKKIDGSSNTVTISPNLIGGSSIDGAASLILSGPGGSRPFATLISDGFDWYIFSA